MRTLKRDDIIGIMEEYAGNYILFEKGDNTSGDMTRSFIVLKDSDGSDAEIKDEDGRIFSPELSLEVFDELQRTGKIRERESRENGHQSIYVLADAKQQGEAA